MTLSPRAGDILMLKKVMNLNYGQAFRLERFKVGLHIKTTEKREPEAAVLPVQPKH